MGWSNAERQSRWRARRIAAAEVLRNAAKTTKGAPAEQQLAKARLEIAVLRARVKELEAAEKKDAKPKAAKPAGRS